MKNNSIKEIFLVEIKTSKVNLYDISKINNERNDTLWVGRQVGR